MVTNFVTLSVATLAATTFVAAHAGCNAYQHGVGLLDQGNVSEEQIALLRVRHPHVNARVIRDVEEQKRHIEARQLQKRATPTTYPAALTRVNSAVIAQLSSGPGTSESMPTLSTPTPGATPPVSGAPALPSVALIPSEWPALDHPPPTNSPEVQQWLSEINLSGIPFSDPTGLNGCQNTTANAAAIANSSASGRCWWTCSGCTRETDITYCPTKNTWGLSYDDGPNPATSPKLLNYLDQTDLKATIFTVGSRALSYPALLQYEYMDGHQIAVHTWSHFPLTTLTNEQIVAEFGWSKKIIHAITGVTPKFFRPPYGDIDDRVRYIAMQMGLQTVIWTRYNGRTFDTEDWQIAGGVVNATTVAENFDSILNMAPQMSTGFIVLEHDLYQQSTDLAVNYVLPKALANPNLSIQPIYQCLGETASQAYWETSGNGTQVINPTQSLVGATGSGFVAISPASGSSNPFASAASVTTASGASASNAQNAKSSALAVASMSAGCLALTTLLMLALA